jgi:O-antigen ligase
LPGTAWSRSGAAALLLLPGALTVWLAFDDGGFFAGAPATLVVILVLASALRVVFAPSPFAGIGPAVAVPAGALLLLSGWTLLSGSWSDADGRAIVELSRPLGYALVLLLIGSLSRDDDRLAWLVRIVAAALTFVALSGLVTQLLPDVWRADESVQSGRLSHPIGYWNAAGFCAALAALLCLHLACDVREHLAVRVLGAAAAPALAATVLFTFSRGAIAAGALGLVAYLVLARPQGALPGLLATVPASVIAVIAAYGADEVTGDDPFGDAAIAEGQDVMLVVVASMVMAAVLLVLARRLGGDDALPRVAWPARRWVLAGAAGAVVAAVVLGAPGAIADQADRFWKGDEVSVESEDLRSRLSEVGNHGRRLQWQIAIDAFEDSPVEGNGAGTYQLLYLRHRDSGFEVLDAHSLYVEMLGELGAVGLLLVVVVVVAIAAGLVRRLRGPDRTLTGVVLAAWLMWAFHAGLEWHWELPAVTLPVLALAAAALARRADPGETSRLGIAPRALVTLGLLAVAILPATVAWSQVRLDDAVDHLRAGEDADAARAAIDAIDAVGARVEPWEALGYAQLRLGRAPDAVRAMGAAVQREPDGWEPAYGLALAQAYAGRDPRPQLRRARRLNPHEELLTETLRAFERTPRGRWRQVVSRSPALLPAEPGIAGTLPEGNGESDR